MIIKNALVSIKIIRHYQLLSENVRQTPVGSLTHHGLRVLRQLLVQLLIQLLLPLHLLQLLDQDLRELCGAELVRGLGWDPVSPGDEGVGLGKILFSSVLTSLLLDLPRLSPQVLLIML